MPNESNTPDPLERYVALRTLRDNVFYQKPLTYSLLDFAEDLPGPTRGGAMWFSDFLPSVGIISKDPAKRKIQLDAALSAAKESKNSTGAAMTQAFKNALSLGVAGMPASFVTSGLFRLLGPRMFLKGGRLQNPFTLGKNISALKTNQNYRKKLLKNVLQDSITGGVLSGVTGAATPLIAGTAKPSDAALEEAKAFLQQAPTVGALPGADLIHALRADKTYSRPHNMVLGAGLGGTMGALGGFVPPALNIPSHLLAAVFKKRNPLAAIAKDFSGGAAKHIPLNTAFLGGVGALTGAALPNTTKHNE